MENFVNLVSFCLAFAVRLGLVGRQQKADLAREITEAVVRVLGGSPDSVDILYRDIARSDWATGGVLWSDKPKS